MTATAHTHPHPHPHIHPGDAENPFAGQGAVMLDIGDGVGALVVQMPSSMLGAEIEIRPAGSPDDAVGGHHPHVAVVDRPTPAGPAPSLVYADLPEGGYELTEKGGGPVLARASVVGGEVTHLSWPS